MGDVPISVDDDKGADAQPDDDGRGRPLQDLIDAWVAIPRRQRTDVLRGLWKSEQRLTTMAGDMTTTGDAGKKRRRWCRETLTGTRAARYLLRGLANALDPKPEPVEVAT